MFLLKFMFSRYISLVIWGIVSISLIPLMIWVATSLVGFSRSSYRCDGSYTASRTSWWIPLYSALFGILPIVVVVGSTVWLLYFVKKVRGLQRQSIVTNIVVSVVYIVAIFPYAVLQGSYIVLDKREYPKFYERLYRLSTFLLWINMISNPLVYYFTVASYKNFLRRLLKFGSKQTKARSNKAVNSFGSSGVFYPRLDVSATDVELSTYT